MALPPLKWNQRQKGIYDMLTAGATTKDIKAKGYKLSLIKKVKQAIAHGDNPTAAPRKEVPPGEPLFEATTKGERVSLDPIIIMRYDSVRHALGWGKEDYSLGHFIDEATDIATQLVGAIPPGFTKTETKEAKVALATAVQDAEGGK